MVRRPQFSTSILYPMIDTMITLYKPIATDCCFDFYLESIEQHLKYSVVSGILDIRPTDFSLAI